VKEGRVLGEAGLGGVTTRAGDLGGSAAAAPGHELQMSGQGPETEFIIY
jgi:hypothetical protein